MAGWRVEIVENVKMQNAKEFRADYYRKNSQWRTGGLEF
ncbi:hypothetical protein SAMN06296427_105205 [Moheibacter sediminis]|uniref:Uncharacterized protein n=1 Tax=Moheibacter sediminis TaxID=1434700 RepID=A0A1W2B054_9FLAO|nr:hypothetical protein SAMN06296427_105205 [Moheibacter sediminis]